MPGMLLLALAVMIGATSAEVWPIPGLGRVNGTKVGPVNEFYAIKYGQAGRFEQSRAASPWSDLLDASKEGPPCVQEYDGSFIGVEDCLTLDVRSCGATDNLPVLLWIHGGGNPHAVISAARSEAAAIILLAFELTFLTLLSLTHLPLMPVLHLTPLPLTLLLSLALQSDAVVPADRPNQRLLC